MPDKDSRPIIRISEETWRLDLGDREVWTKRTHKSASVDVDCFIHDEARQGFIKHLTRFAQDRGLPLPNIQFLRRKTATDWPVLPANQIPAVMYTISNLTANW